MAPSDSDLNDLFADKEGTPASDDSVLTHDQIFGEILGSLGGTATAPRTAPESSSAPVRGPVRVQLPEPAEPARYHRSPEPRGTDRLDRVIAEIRSREAQTKTTRISVKAVEELLGMAPPEAARSSSGELPPPVASDDVLELLEAEKNTAPEVGHFRASEAGAEEPGAVLDLADLVEDAVDPRVSFQSEPLLGPFGPFELLERVALGGMAEVYRARRAGPEGFAKILAVKRILPYLATNPDFVEMFVNEAKMVSRLDHPNIVGIQELGRTEGSYYIAMEFVSGRDLRAILDRLRNRGRKLPLDLAVFVARKVCAALDYAHRAKDENGSALGIVHSDISPQNILISYDGEVKLTDFGIAKAASRAAESDDGLLRGKLFYMSPEQASGEDVDQRSDIFSLGIVLYEMTTGLKPFTAGDEGGVYDALRSARVQAPASLNPSIPDRLSEAILKALERSPDHRFEDAAALSRALDRSLDGPGVDATELTRFMELLFDDRPKAEEPRVRWEASTVPGLPIVEPPANLDIHIEDGPAKGEGLGMPSLEQMSTGNQASSIRRVWKKIFG
jgi:serine/threonine protein kinase